MSVTAAASEARAASVPPPGSLPPPGSPPKSGRLPLPAAVAYPAALLSGVLYFLAFPGMDVWPLGFVALVPLSLALRSQTPRRGLALGWVAGFTMTMLGFYWLVSMLETFSGFPTALCALFAAILSAYQGGRMALLGWLSARAELKRWPAWLAFALAFPASELVFPLLFPWYYAATVHQLPALLQTAELGGPLLVGISLVFANLALAELCVGLLDRPRNGAVSWKQSVPWKRVVIFAAVPLIALGYGFARIPMLEARIEKAPKLRVALVQANMSLLGKRLRPEESLERHLSLTRGAMQEKPVDLVVWSETSIGGAVDERAANAHYRQTLGTQLPVPTIFGAVLRAPVEDARKYTLSNSALVTNAEGSVVGRYDKQFLLGFGEYLPFGDTFPILYEWSPNSGRFTPGKSFEPLPVGEHSVATFICYEDIIPSFVNRIMSNGSPGLLVNLTNDAWFGDTTEPWIHLALAKLRAVEQRRFFVRSTNSGVSAFIDPLGRVIDSTPTFSEIAIAEDLRWLDGSTLFRVLGDTPWWLVSMAAFAMAFLSRPNRLLGRSSQSVPAPAIGARASVPPSQEASASKPPAARKSGTSTPTPAPPREPAPTATVDPPAGATADLAQPSGSTTTGSEVSAPSKTPTLNPSEFGPFPKPGEKPGS